MGKLLERLFLLEVLVERITLGRAILEKYYTSKEEASVPLSVKVKFIHFPYFEINQEDFKQHECLDAAAVGDFSSGKSCLFPMEPNELIKAIKQSPLHFILLRKTQGTCPPETLGVADVFLSSDMCKTIRKAVNSDDLPISSTLQDSYNLRSSEGQDAGFISVFLRLSCFGQSIVTQFKLVNETNSFLFKNSKADSAFECEKCQCASDGDEKDAIDLPESTTLIPTSEIRVSSKTSKVIYDKNAGHMQISNNTAVSSSAVCGCDKKKSLAINEDICDSDTCKKRSVRKDFTEDFAKETEMYKNSPPCIPCEACRLLKSKTYSSKLFMQCKKCQPCLPYEDFLQSKQPNDKYFQPNVPYTEAPQKQTCCQKCLKLKLPHEGLQQNSAPCIPCKRCARRQPVISCTECDDPLTPLTSQCPGEQEIYKQNVCDCDLEVFCKDFNDCPTNYDCKSDYIDVTCSPECCSDVCREPFSERDEEDVVPVMPVYCSQENIYDPDFERGRCPEIVRRRCEQWKNMFTCDCQICSRNTQAEYTQTSGLASTTKGTYEQTILNPPIRYDTTGRLSPAYGGLVTGKIVVQVPPPRYDTTGKLSAAFNHPPVRYDTTGALSPAYQGGVPIPLYNSDSTKHITSGLRGADSSPGMMQTCPKDPAFAAAGLGKYSFSEVFPDESATKHRKRKRDRCWRPPPKNRRRYVYSWGGSYPGVKIGHRYCLIPYGSIPAKMGWRWDLPEASFGLKYRPGWRPGAISKNVAQLIRNLKRAAGFEIETKQKTSEEKGEATTEKPEVPPTLHIHRRDGSYYISMHPINQIPEENNVPIQFRIPASKKEENEESCGCEDEESTSSSELEIEFMAPGVYWPEEKEFKTVDTQCYEYDWTQDPSVQYAMNVGNNTSTNTRKEKGKGKKKLAKAGTTPEVPNISNTQTGSSPNPDLAPRMVAWEYNQPTAVGRK